LAISSKNFHWHLLYSGPDCGRYSVVPVHDQDPLIPLLKIYQHCAGSEEQPVNQASLWSADEWNRRLPQHSGSV
jgi:hypothetical protein